MKLFSHQREALVRSREDNLALFHDCGCGKTLTALHIIKHWKAKGIVPALVVCPLSIIEAAWIEDCQKFTPELSITSLWLPQTSNRRLKQIDLLIDQDFDIYVANYETFKTLLPTIKRKKFQILIVDESSKMKNPTSQITRALLSMAGITTRAKGGVKFYADETIPHRYLLSGTPAPNDESEYWAQVKFITGEGDDVFNDNFYAFRSRYFFSIPLGRTGQNIWKFRKETKQEFTDKLSEIAHVVRKQDAVDLPDQIHEKRYIELSREERKAYNKLKETLVLEFADEMVLASSALVEVMKLRQLTSGFCYGEDTHQIGKSKLNELKALLEEIGDNQVIIWCNFKHEIATLFKELVDCDALWSGTHNKDETIRNFQQGKVKYLIANPQSAAHGLTFTNCNYAVYYSLNYSYEYQKQSQDRIHRIGQQNKCTYYYLIAKNTVDEIIYRAVCEKAELSKEVLNYLRTNSHGRQKAKECRQFQPA